jgi:hypothetical protein
MSIKKLTDKELTELVRSISEPVFKFTIKRFMKQIKEAAGIDLNSAITAFIASMAATDANLLKFIKAFAMNETKENLDIEKLKQFFSRELNIQLEAKLH